MRGALLLPYFIIIGDDKQPRDIDTNMLAVSVVAGSCKITAYCSKKAAGKYQGTHCSLSY